MRTVFDAGLLDDVSNLHSIWTGNLTALAIETHLQVLIEEISVFHAVTHKVWPRMFRPGIFRFDSRNRAIYRANGTFHTLFQFMLADIFKLYSGLHSVIYLGYGVPQR